MEFKFENIEDINLEDIYDYLENGSRDEDPPSNLYLYMRAMERVYMMHNRIDTYGSRDAIVRHLEKFEGLSYYLANKLYNQTVEYFYCDSEISKEAWMQKIAEGQEKDINLARNIAEDVTDLSKISGMWKNLRETIEKAFPDGDAPTEDIMPRWLKVYTQTPEDVGIPSVNRRELSAWIDDNLADVSEIVKERIKIEAGILPGNFFLEEKNNPRKL